jgi:site-specific recombinase XerD
MGYSLIDSWSRWWRLQNRAETTLINYTSSLRLFIRDVLDGDEAALLDVDRGMLEGYVERRMQKPVNAADSDVRAFRSFFGWASGDGDEMGSPSPSRSRTATAAQLFC